MIVYVNPSTEITVETKLTEETRYPGGQRLDMTNNMLNMCTQQNTAYIAVVVCVTVNIPYCTKFSPDKNFAQCSCFVLAQKFR